jgi:hypothetical protein
MRITAWAKETAEDIQKKRIAASLNFSSPARYVMGWLLMAGGISFLVNGKARFSSSSAQLVKWSKRKSRWGIKGFFETRSSKGRARGMRLGRVREQSRVEWTPASSISCAWVLFNFLHLTLYADSRRGGRGTWWPSSLASSQFSFSLLLIPLASSFFPARGSQAV